MAKQWLGRSAKEKKFSVTYYREEYERNIGLADFSKRTKGVQRLQVDTFYGLRSDNNLKWNTYFY
ncbi:Transposase [hydrothermal vent metagenome]|uniref:Transposase n=1 Tax=hydrothermal vent metagenome TaxID=652676 RepID=A0A3B0TAP1_9ZZZZ